MLCKTCGKPRCKNCKEVEIRMEEYLKSENGVKFILEKMEKQFMDLVTIQSFAGPSPMTDLAKLYATRFGDL